MVETYTSSDILLTVGAIIGIGVLGWAAYKAFRNKN